MVTMGVVHRVPLAMDEVELGPLLWDVCMFLSLRREVLECLDHEDITAVSSARRAACREIILFSNFTDVLTSVSCISLRGPEPDTAPCKLGLDYLASTVQSALHSAAFLVQELARWQLCSSRPYSDSRATVARPYSDSRRDVAGNRHMVARQSRDCRCREEWEESE